MAGYIKMKILLFGKNGQVGWELQRSLSSLGQIVALDYFDNEYCGDLRKPDGIARTVQLIKPDIVVNAAAYTAVDKAESEPDSAYLLNARGVEALAKETAKLDALLIHYSTDYVFDGEGVHYRKEEAPTRPLNVYGKSKLGGEQAVKYWSPRHFVFRTSWVYAARGENFVRTMLRLAHEKETLSIVDDQYGAPTSAELLADSTALAIYAAMHNRQLKYGIYHLVASGKTSWYDYAQLVFSTARNLGDTLTLKKVIGVAASDYPAIAKRPTNSRLCNQKFQETFDIVLPDWKDGVERVVTEMLGK